MVVDVGFEPAGLRRAGARAVDEVRLHLFQAEAAGHLRHENRGQGLVLGDVGDLRGQVRGDAGFALLGEAPGRIFRGMRGGLNGGVRHLARGTVGVGARSGAGLHTQGDGVGDEHEADVRCGHPLLGKSAVGLDDRVDIGLQEAGGVVVGARLVHGEVDGSAPVPTDPGGSVGLEAVSGGAIRSGGEQGNGAGQVLAVLAAPGVGAEGGGGQGQDVAGAGVGQLAQGLTDERVPVAVADDDR